MKIGSRNNNVKIMKESLRRLYSFSKKRFSKTSRNFGLEKKDINDIENLHMFADIQASEKAFLDSIKKILEKKILEEYDDVNPYVRDFQVFSSYYVNIMPNGAPVTRFLYGVDLSKQECNRRQPEDYKEFIILLYKAHREIENFLINIEQEANKRILEINNKLKKQGHFAEILDKHNRDQNIDSITHYVLNWYFRLVPFNVYKNSPKKLAAIALYVTKRFNEHMTEKACCNFTNKKLSVLGEWKSSGGVASAATSAFYDIVYSLPDIQLLFIHHGHIPSDWKKRMKKVAPAWEDQLEDEDLTL